MRPRLLGCLVGAVIAAGLCLAALAVMIVLRPGGQETPRPRPSPSATEIVAERRLDERRMELTIRSRALDATTKVRLLLPRGWESRTGWPVLWLLHGGLDDETSWTAKTDVEALTRDTGVLVVMPDGGKCGSYSDWWNGGAGGPPRWETYHLKELRPLLEARYRAGGRQAIAGYSMGGQGAMLYAAKGHFEAAASFSGALHILGPGVPQAVMAGTALGCFGTDWKRIWGDPEEQREVWRAHNPYDLADELKGVRLYVAAGEGDLVEDLANRAARAFAGRLDELGIPVRTHFYRGGHNHTSWQRELHRAFPLLMSAIGAKPVR
ncbi:esterase family protein [Nonomuraea sp. FMUSA5-5]|uniref:Esterase family protein n=1 Tax=Nonomuraea composti TaxID=2720023 RepID=A0ABX1B1Y8_9ACTN|nr:alpha/beta hydrolase family protein [Nonomuraea sp. FMUSA5-5]NJP89008.1 esterase family protein [Nonomuraea sp. FMUSA5-5]